MREDDELFHLLMLHRQTGGRPDCLAKLLTRFGSAAAVLREGTPDLLTLLGLSDAVIAGICGSGSEASRRQADADMRWLAQEARSLVIKGSTDYPARLDEIHDAPLLLFCHGDIALLSSLQVAMVGSRKMSATGRKIANMLAADLCRAGVTVTSGLARGIDAASHRGALSVDGNTIAVLGTGCDLVYPSMNARLADEIVEHGGLLVSEFPLGVGARDYHFPQRNRIVTGMSVGTVVVEAALKSGSLISARLAMEQGREVFAVPGSVLNPLSAGCHRLIRDGAKLTANVDDVIEELVGIVSPPRSEVAPTTRRDERQRKLIDVMNAEPLSVDELTGGSGLPAAEILALLIELEIDGVVTAGPGGYCLSPRWLEARARDGD